MLPKDEIHLFHPSSWTETEYRSQKSRTVNGVESTPFDAHDVSNWYKLFLEYDYFIRNGDSTITGIVAQALLLYSFEPEVISKAIMLFQEESKQSVLGCLESIAFSLSPGACYRISQILSRFGKQNNAFFPKDLYEAAKDFNLQIKNSSTVYSVFDEIWDLKEYYSDRITPTNSVEAVLLWYLNGGEISIEHLSKVFAYADENARALLIKRYFHSVSQKTAYYSSAIPGALLAQDYKYYSLFRHYLTRWPGKMDVTSEFLLDCIETYKATQEQRFQVTNGVLDRIIRRATESRIPLSINYRRWLYTCEGGVRLNTQFTGFINIYITYELDEYAFEEETLKKNIKTLIQRHCRGIYREEREPKIDPQTGLQALDSSTGQPIFKQKQIFDNKWQLNNETDYEIVGLFINNSKRPIGLPSNQFSVDMIDLDVVKERVLSYVVNKFKSERPEIEYRINDDIISLFAYQIKMRAQYREDISIGANPGTEDSIIYERVRDYVTKCFGESLECDFDHSKLSDITQKTLFSFNNGTTCFHTLPMAKGGYHVYCYPSLSEQEHFLTGKKFAICNGATCFKTSIRRNIEMEDYKLINLLEIIGYNVLDETEAGLFPNTTYRIFVGQISKAINFYRRLTCRTCGHVLFPVQYNQNRLNQFNHFKCLLPSCNEYNKEVYLNYCFQCKKGLIDSRDTHKCPNGLYICPNKECNSCCSNEMFERRAQKYRNNGWKVPDKLSQLIGKGHLDLGMFFCAKCGAQKINGSCPNCDIQESPSDDNDSH